MLLEWLPTGAAAPAPAGMAATASAPAGLSEGARARLQRAVQMYEARAGGALSEGALLHALAGFELRPAEEEADRAPCAALLEQARGGAMQRPVYLPCISPVSPLHPPYLPYISAISPRRAAARCGATPRWRRCTHRTS